MTLQLKLDDKKLDKNEAARIMHELQTKGIAVHERGPLETVYFRLDKYNPPTSKDIFNEHISYPDTFKKDVLTEIMKNGVGQSRPVALARNKDEIFMVTKEMFSVFVVGTVFPSDIIKNVDDFNFLELPKGSIK